MIALQSEVNFLINVVNKKENDHQCPIDHLKCLLVKRPLEDWLQTVQELAQLYPQCLLDKRSLEDILQDINKMYCPNPLDK